MGEYEVKVVPFEMRWLDQCGTISYLEVNIFHFVARFCAWCFASIVVTVCKLLVSVATKEETHSQTDRGIHTFPVRPVIAS